MRDDVAVITRSFVDGVYRSWAAFDGNAEKKFAFEILPKIERRKSIYMPTAGAALWIEFQVAYGATTIPLMGQTLSKPRRSRRQHSSNLLLILLLGLTVFNIRLFLHGMDLALEGYTDFSAFYSAATLVSKGSRKNLYTYDAQEKIQREIFAEAESRTGPLLYYHPSYEILVFLPLAATSYSKAYVAWVLVNLIILFAVALLLFPSLLNLRPVFSINIFATFFSFFPIFMAIYHGQDSILLLLLFAGAFASVKRNRPYLAGILLALGLFRFQIVAPFMLLFLVRKQWKVIRGFATTAVLVTGTSYFLIGWRGMTNYVNFLWEINQNLSDREHQVHFAIYPTTLVNLRGLLYSLFGGALSDSLITIISLSFSLLILLWFCVWLLRRKIDYPDIGLEFSLNIVVILLVGFHTHLHDFSLLILAILLVSNHYARLPYSRELPVWSLRLTMLLLLMTPVYVALISFELTSLLIIPLALFARVILIEIEELKCARPTLGLASSPG